VAKAYQGDDRVYVAVMSGGESATVLETFWRNVYLRSPMLFDATGAIAAVNGLYGQPETVSMPYGRSFVIRTDGITELTQFTYDPDLILATIDGLLGDG
jgi:hypothetical protein